VSKPWPYRCASCEKAVAADEDGLVCLPCERDRLRTELDEVRKSLDLCRHDRKSMGVALGQATAERNRALGAEESYRIERDRLALQLAAANAERDEFRALCTELVDALEECVASWFTSRFVEGQNYADLIARARAAIKDQ
jgi:hypothetical protein